MSINKLEILEHGVMLTDYFHGTSGVWINVYVDKNTTIRGVLEQLRQEIDLMHLVGYIESVAEYHGFTGDLEAVIDNELQKMQEYCPDKLNKVYDSTLEWDFDQCEEFDELPVLIFTIEFKEG